MLINILIILLLDQITYKFLMFRREKLYIEYIILIPANIQNIISSIFVIILIVLNDFLSILNTSNNNPIKTPFTEKIKKIYA